MSAKLDEQIGAVSALVGLDPRLEGVLATLRWLKTNREAVLQTHALLQHDAVKAVQATFPEARIVGIKSSADLTREDGEFLADPEWETDGGLLQRE